MKQIIMNGLVIGCAILFLAIACRKRDAMLPDILVNFESNAQGVTASENSLVVKVELTSGVDRDVPVTINLTPQGVVYGVDFITSPATIAGSLALTIPSGNNEAFFTISKVAGALFDGDEKIIFDIYSSGAPVLIGIKKQLVLSFAELIASTSSATINGGGPSFPNKVFIDLSANRQSSALRTSWDLGFYTGTDDHRVILNSSSAMMAKQISKNDLTQVGAADTTGFSGEVAFSQFAPTTTSLSYIDYPNGDLTRTAIGFIYATASENKVYIINRGMGIGNPGTPRGWKKIRIIRNASSGYTLQHADIAATAFQEINISKDENYFFKYISFETGAVNVEPEKKKWDFAWTYFSNVTNFGTGEVPYLFQDIIVQNRNVQTVKVMTAIRSFADFDSTHLAGLSFSSVQNTIGADWRSGGGPTSAPAVRTDRYYIIRDGDNNFYKLRFTALTQNGERGYPAYEAMLVKKGG